MEMIDIDELYKEAVSLGLELDSHESDLYIKHSPEAAKLVDSYKFKNNVTSFVSAVDGKMYYNIPFGYLPWWRKRLSKLSEIPGEAIKDIHFLVSNIKYVDAAFLSHDKVILAVRELGLVSMKQVLEAEAQLESKYGYIELSIRAHQGRGLDMYSHLQRVF